MTKKYKTLRPPPGRRLRPLRRVEVEKPGDDVGRGGVGAGDDRPPGGAVPAERRKLLVVEGVEDAVALGDVEVGLLRGDSAEPGGEQARGEARLRARSVGLGAPRDRPGRASSPEGPACRAQPGGARGQSDCRSARSDRYRQADGGPHLCEVHVLQDRSCLAPPGRRAAGRGQARVPGRLRRLRRRPLAARLLNHRHARRRRPRPAQPEPQPRRPPHLPRRPRPERAGAAGPRPPTRSSR